MAVTTYFGLCDSAGNPSNSTAGNTGAAETDWNQAITYTCPGVGTQVVQEITADLKNVTNYNIRLAIFDSTGTVKLAEGTAAVAVVGASDSWQGHIGQANITPNPANLVGGTNYIIALTSSGDTHSDHVSNVGGTDGSFNASDLTAGFGATLPAGSNTSLVFPVRVGVQPLSIGYWPQLGALGPGLSPGQAGEGSARFTASNWWPYSLPVANVTVITEGIGAFNWAGTNSPLTKILTEGVGAWTWLGTTSAVPRLVKGTPGAWTWAGTASPLSKSINTLKGAYTWAGLNSPLSKSLAPAPAAYTWAGTRATLDSPTVVNTAAGAWAWAGLHSSLSTLVQQAVGRWTWAGKASTVTVPGAVATAHYFPVPGRRTRR